MSAHDCAGSCSAVWAAMADCGGLRISDKILAPGVCAVTADLAAFWLDCVVYRCPCGCHGADKLNCNMCGLAYVAAQGRKHGPTFKCWGCLNIEQMIRLNLGSTCELQQWSPEALGAFFQSCQAQDKSQGVNWKRMAVSSLAHLTDYNLKTAHAAARMLGRTLGKLGPLPCRAQSLRLPNGTRFSRGAEIGCVEYTRGAYLPLTPTTCAQLHGAVTHEGKIWLLEEELSMRCSHVENLTVWRRCEPRTWKLRPLSEVRGCRPYMISRERGKTRSGSCEERSTNQISQLKCYFVDVGVEKKSWFRTFGL